MIIHVTKEAENHLQTMIEARQAKGFRLSVKASGCSGYRYAPEIVQDIKNDDIAIAMSPNLVIYLAPDSIPFLTGTTIDYVKKGLGQAQLKFYNPNVDDECGCGESFSWRKEKTDE